MTNRESICKQQIHCLSCPLSVRIAGKDCRALTHKELIEMIVREPDNLCVICGAQIPEGRMICPMCGSSESDTFARAMARPIHKDKAESSVSLIRTDIPKEDEPLAKAAVETALKLKDEIEQAFRQGYTTGFNEGMKAACELKQQNAQLRKDNAILRAAIERRDSENNQDGWYE